MCPALTDGDLVVDLVHQCCASLCKALLAKGMGGGVAIADTLPGPSVLLVYVWRAFVPVILPSCQGAMLFTVLSAR